VGNTSSEREISVVGKLERSKVRPGQRRQLKLYARKVGVKGGGDGGEGGGGGGKKGKMVKSEPERRRGFRSPGKNEEVAYLYR